jgi:hypothetical protein
MACMSRRKAAASTQCTKAHGHQTVTEECMLGGGGMDAASWINAWMSD